MSQINIIHKLQFYDPRFKAWEDIQSYSQEEFHIATKDMINKFKSDTNNFKFRVVTVDNPKIESSCNSNNDYKNCLCLN